MKTLSSSIGIGGAIKSRPEDFVVEEITTAGKVVSAGKRYEGLDLGFTTCTEGEFTLFVLQKKGWNTIQALKEIARKCGRGIRSVGFAGTKDRNAVSTQLCSIFGAAPQQVLGAAIKDTSINGAWKSKEGVHLGDLRGNRFTVHVREAVAARNVIEDTINELGGVFPNYFGSQRFGFRSNNVKIGLAILRGDFEAAAAEFLTNTENETNEQAIAARKRLAEEGDFDKAYSYFPTYLKYERSMLEYLSKFPENYANAIRRLPRQLSLMFVHSVESLIFNTELEDRVEARAVLPEKGELFCGVDGMGFPDMSKMQKYDPSDQAWPCFPVCSLPGYRSGQAGEAAARIMERLGISNESFRIKGLPELSSGGSYRVMFSPYVDLKYEAAGADALFSFSLQSGAYATIFINEFMKNQG